MIVESDERLIDHLVGLEIEVLFWEGLPRFTGEFIRRNGNQSIVIASGESHPAVLGVSIDLGKVSQIRWTQDDPGEYLDLCCTGPEGGGNHEGYPKCPIHEL